MVIMQWSERHQTTDITDYMLNLLLPAALKTSLQNIPFMIFVDTNTQTIYFPTKMKLNKLSTSTHYV